MKGVLAALTALCALGAPAAAFGADGGASAEAGRDGVTRQLEALGSTPATPKRHAEEARLYYFQGALGAVREERERSWSLGRDRATLALGARPGMPEAVLWWGANEGALAESRKDLSSLRKIKELEKAFLELRKNHPAYGDGAADRALGRLYQKAPSIVSVGSMRKAGEHLRAAVERFPDHPPNLAFMADFLLERGEDKKAREFARKALASPGLAERPLEAIEWRAISERVLARTAPAGGRP